MSPIVASPRYIIDKIFMLKYLTYLAFEELIGNSFFHVDYN